MGSYFRMNRKLDAVRSTTLMAAFLTFLLSILWSISWVHDNKTGVLHTICDGSPNHLEFKVAEALEIFNRDKDSKIRRQAHIALASYHRTGKWNIL